MILVVVSFHADPEEPAQIFFKDLAGEPKHQETLRKVFLDPLDLDPSKHAAAVTREVAGYLANLAKKLESDGHPQEQVATFLMRCLFTMFAEDVGLLPDKVFTHALETLWVPSPASFTGGVESLWRTMNEGGHLFGVVGKILKFNGGLFQSPVALPLDEHALRLLLVAAERNWAEGPVTGEDVPDEAARVPIYRYVNPRKAEWPEAEFIVGNPPFVGNKRMRAVLGDGYVEALRVVHDDVPETADCWSATS